MALPHTFRLGLGVLLAGLLVLGCSDRAASTSQIQVEDFRYVKLPNGDREFTGTVVNSSSTQYPVVQVDVALYGADGARTGSQRIDVEDVLPDSTRSFRARVNADATIERARVRGVLVP